MSVEQFRSRFKAAASSAPISTMSCVSASLANSVCVYRVSLPLRETKKKLLASEARLRQPRPRDGNSLLARPACGLGPTGPDSPVGGPAPAVESLAPVA